MESSGSPASTRETVADLVIALLATGLVAVAVAVPAVRETPVRVALGLAFVLVVPGYVVVAALFPARDRDDLDWIDRLSLSVVASVIVVSSVALATAASPSGLGLGSTLTAVSLVTAAVAVVAVRRRLALPPAARVRVPYGRWARDGVAAVRPDGAVDLALTLALAGAVVIAAGAVGFAVADGYAGYGPDLDDDDGYSALSLVDAEGDLLTNESATLEPGTTESVALDVENREGEPTEYVVVALEQELDDGAVAEQRELDRFEVAVDDGATETTEREVEPTTEDGRLVWVLYPDGAPAEPSVESATAHVSLRVSAEGSDA